MFILSADSDDVDIKRKKKGRWWNLTKHHKSPAFSADAGPPADYLKKMRFFFFLHKGQEGGHIFSCLTVSSPSSDLSVGFGSREVAVEEKKKKMPIIESAGGRNNV